MGTNGLPGHQGEQYLAERRALRAAEDVLLAAGCKVVEVPSSFDDGLDLFVALTHEYSVEPYMAAVQVKGGSSHHRRIVIGNRRDLRPVWPPDPGRARRGARLLGRHHPDPHR